MSVQTKEAENKLILELDNGDKTKIEEALKKWNFKDMQSLLRFSVSVLLETEDKALWIKSNGESTLIAPAKHSIRGDNE